MSSANRTDASSGQAEVSAVSTQRVACNVRAARSEIRVRAAANGLLLQSCRLSTRCRLSGQPPATWLVPGIRFRALRFPTPNSICSASNSVLLRFCYVCERNQLHMYIGIPLWHRLPPVHYHDTVRQRFVLSFDARAGARLGVGPLEGEGRGSTSVNS